MRLAEAVIKVNSAAQIEERVAKQHLRSAPGDLVLEERCVKRSLREEAKKNERNGARARRSASLED
jgi:hypothetical protein